MNFIILKNTRKQIGIFFTSQTNLNILNILLKVVFYLITLHIGVEDELVTADPAENTAQPEQAENLEQLDPAENTKPSQTRQRTPYSQSPKKLHEK